LSSERWDGVIEAEVEVVVEDSEEEEKVNLYPQNRRSQPSPSHSQCYQPFWMPTSLAPQLNVLSEH